MIFIIGIFTKYDFQVAQGSVETLLRWGGKRLYYSLANLFGTLSIKFYQNQPRFVEDTTQTFWHTFFLDTVYNDTSCVWRVEAACLQEDIAGAHLPNLLYDSAQLRHLFSDVADRLYWVPGTVVGSGTSGTSMYWVWTHDTREVQRSPQRRLHSTSVHVSC